MLEAKEQIESSLLVEVAKVLKVPAEAIKNFDEEKAVTVISSTFNDCAAVINNNPVFNPTEKWVAAVEENKKLYERLLESEKRK